MKKRFLQSLILQLTYSVIFRWFLRIVIGVRFGNADFLRNEKQFIIIANHNSHLDTLSLLASLPHKIIWRVKAVAAEDYFGNTRIKKAFSNYFINTLLIRRKVSKDIDSNPIEKMLEAIDAGYSLILFPEGTRGEAGQMEKLKPGIAKILSVRPNVKYVPVYLTGMGKSLPKGKLLMLPFNSTVNYGESTQVNSTEISYIMEQIASDFELMKIRYQPPIQDDDE